MRVSTPVCPPTPLSRGCVQCLESPQVFLVPIFFFFFENPRRLMEWSTWCIIDRQAQEGWSGSGNQRMFHVSTHLKCCTWCIQQEVQSVVDCRGRAHSRSGKSSSSSSSSSSLQMENMVHYLAELGVMHYDTMIMFSPSMVAASAIYAARSSLRQVPIWTSTLKHHTGYSETQLM